MLWRKATRVATPETFALDNMAGTNFRPTFPTTRKGSRTNPSRLGAVRKRTMDRIEGDLPGRGSSRRVLRV